MKSTFSRNLMSILILFSVLFTASETGVGFAETWKFGVISDTQWSPTGKDDQGVAIHIIDALNAEMIRHGVEVVVHVGDLVNVPSQKAFDTCADRFKTLSDAGIRFLPVRGNHDSQQPQSSNEFRKAFPNTLGASGNKDDSSRISNPSIPYTGGLTYSFVHKKVKFILLDPYQMDVGKSIVQYGISDYLPWIEKELSDNTHQFAFLVRHKGLIEQKAGRKLPEYTPETEKMENRFFETMQKNGVKYFLAGHDHLYSRATIASPNGKFHVEQIICGSDSHKFYKTGPPYSDRQQTHALETDRVGYLIATVDGDTITFDYYSCEPFGAKPAKPTWEKRESFGYSVNGPLFEKQWFDLKSQLYDLKTIKSIENKTPPMHTVP